VAYNEAGNKVGSAFGVYNFVAMIYALFLPAIAKKAGQESDPCYFSHAGGVGLILHLFY